MVEIPIWLLVLLSVFAAPLAVCVVLFIVALIFALFIYVLDFLIPSEIAIIEDKNDVEKKE